MFSLQKNLDLKAAVQKTFPKRREIFFIGKDQLGSLREKLLRTALPFLAFLIPILFLFGHAPTREALLEGESQIIIAFTMFMIFLSFTVTLIIFVYMFGKWYSKIETYYLDSNSLMHEVIFREKIKLQTYDLDTIDFIYFERKTTSSGSSSSSTTSYYLRVHRKKDEESVKKPGLLFRADKRRIPMIINFIQILEKHNIQVQIQKGFKSALIRDGKWKEELEKVKENICSSCNTSNPLDSTYCEECGEDLKSEE